MGRKYRMGAAIVVGSIFLAVALICGFQYTYQKGLKERQAREEKEQLLPADGTATKEEGYYLRAVDGYVVVYEGDGETVYEYTSICVKNLPEEVQMQVRAGLLLENMKQVYGFLENYSS